MNEPVVAASIAVPIAVPIVVPIVAVSVYPDRARITRRGTLRLVAGDQVVHVEPLPPGLHPDSVRVSGRGPATVLGVDVVTRHHPSTPDERAAALEDERHTILAEIDELADADDVQLKLDAFLEQLGRRAGGGYARSLVSGDSGPEALSEFTDSYGGDREGRRARGLARVTPGRVTAGRGVAARVEAGRDTAARVTAGRAAPA